MQMRDALREGQGVSAADALATSFDISPTQAQAVMRMVVPALKWAMETRSLNGDGLADIVEAIGIVTKANSAGAGSVFRDETAQAQGKTLLATFFPGDRGSLLATAVARQAGVSDVAAAAMLNGLALLTVARMAERAKPTLGALLTHMPSLGRWSKGSPHADLADILRRGCGAGPYGPARLRRVARSRLSRAGGFGGLGVIGWYVRFMLRPLTNMARPLVRAMSS